MPRSYYVYALIDPRDELEFYVGKGTGNRAYCHVRDLKSGRKTVNQYKDAVIKSILNCGQEPIVRIIASGFTDEDQAYEFEEYLIDLFGRRRFEKDGILTNFHKCFRSASSPSKWDQGLYQLGKPSGMLGRKHTVETRVKMGRWQTGRKMSEETKEKIRIKAKRTYAEKYGAERAEELLKKKHDSMLGKNRGAKSEETRQKIRDTKRRQREEALANK